MVEVLQMFCLRSTLAAAIGTSLVGTSVASDPLTSDGVGLREVAYVDVDDSYSVSAGDILHVTCNEAPCVNRLSDVLLPVEGDSLGDAPKLVEGSSARVATITLGDGVKLQVGGTYTLDAHREGAPSGLLIKGRKGRVDVVDRRVKAVQRQFDRLYTEHRKRRLREAASSGSSYRLYFLSYSLEGLTSMFEATSEAHYLRDVCTYVGSIIETASDRDGDGYLDFRARRSDVEKINVPLYDWKGTRPVARLARLLQQEERELCAGKKELIRDFIDREIIEKWSSRMSKSRNLNFIETDGLIHRTAHMGDILLDSYLATGREAQRKLLVEVAHRVAGHIRIYGGDQNAVAWNILFRDKGRLIRDYHPPLRGVSDTSHASGTVAFIVAEALQTELIFGEADLEKLSYTLKHVLWNGSYSSPAFRDFVDGEMYKAKPNLYGNQNISDGWVKLGEYDPEIQRLMHRIVDGKFGNSLQMAGNVARNYAKARWQ